MEDRPGGWTMARGGYPSASGVFPLLHEPFSSCKSTAQSSTTIEPLFTLSMVLLPFHPVIDSDPSCWIGWIGWNGYTIANYWKSIQPCLPPGTPWLDSIY